MAEKILLCLGGGEEARVESTMPYARRAERLVRISKRSNQGGREPGDIDNKFSVTQAGIECLLASGARVISLNQETSTPRASEPRYITEVVHLKRRFIYVADKPLAYSVEEGFVS